MEAVKKRKKPSAGQIFRDIVDSSSCEVMETQGMVRIRFSGKSAVIPSSSNSKMIFHVGPKEKRRPIIGNSRDNQARLAAMTELYNLSGKRPARMVGPVFVFVLLSRRRVAFDSHNFSKTVGDWLEAVELIENDREAEIHCFKKLDYPVLADSPTWENTTDIVMTQKSEIKLYLLRLLEEVQKP